MSNWDTIMQAILQLEKQNYLPSPFLLSPREYKLRHVDRISIRFMSKVERNRKLRNNGWK